MQPRIDHEAVIRMYLEGYEIDELAMIFDAKYSYIKEILLRKGKVKLREKSAIDTGKAKALRRAGWNLNAIAFELCTTVDEVKKALWERINGAG